MEAWASCNDWEGTLSTISDDTNINCGDLFPEEAIHVDIKDIDFGRGRFATRLAFSFSGPLEL